MVTFDFAVYTGGLEEAHPNIEVCRLIHATKAHRNADLKAEMAKEEAYERNPQTSLGAWGME